MLEEKLVHQKLNKYRTGRNRGRDEVICRRRPRIDKRFPEKLKNIRAYAWSDDEINQIIEDIWGNESENYYIGSFKKLTFTKCQFRPDEAS